MRWKTKPQQKVLTSRKEKYLSKDELVDITIRSDHYRLNVIFPGVICCFDNRKHSKNSTMTESCIQTAVAGVRILIRGKGALAKAARESEKTGATIRKECTLLFIAGFRLCTSSRSCASLQLTPFCYSSASYTGLKSRKNATRDLSTSNMIKELSHLKIVIMSINIGCHVIVL